MKLSLGPNKIFGILVLFIITWLIYVPLDFVLSHGFNSYLEIAFKFGRNEIKNELLNNSTAQIIFECLKVVAILIFIWLGLIWIDFFKDKRFKFTKFISKIGDTVYLSLIENKKFVIDLGKVGMFSLLSILGIQIIFYLYFLFTIPLGYDEWWSYNYFSFPGLWATLCYYPIPNNHVFFNLISGLFIQLPIDVEISLRLPSLIVSVISVFYFFKICKFSFNTTISFLLIVFVICAFPFIMYSFLARGYAFSCFFFVMMTYSSIKLFDNYSIKKYRYLLLLSLYLGLFSLPSFFYACSPLFLVFGVYMLCQKRFYEIFLFIKDGLIGFLLTAASYSFILFFNNPENLLNPNRQPANYFITAPGSIDNIISHLKAVAGFFLFNEKVIFIFSILIVVSIFIFAFKNIGIKRYICTLSAASAFSPIYLLIIHGQIPFERTWVYLIFPISLCIGFIIKNLIYLLEKNISLRKLIKFKLYFHSALLIICICFLLKFTDQYKVWTGRIDYQFDDLKEQHLKYLMHNVDKIAYTEVGYEYLLTGPISAICNKYVPFKKVEMSALENISEQDILIIDRTVLYKYYKALKNYKVLKYIDNGRIIVYAKSSIISSKE